MFCIKYGRENDDNAYKCLDCGDVLQQLENTEAPAEQVPNYLAQAILVTLFCCMPFGIAAIVFAAQVNSKIQAGDIQGATESSRKAKMWSWWSLGVGLFVQVAYFFFYVLIGMAGAL